MASRVDLDLDFEDHLSNIYQQILNILSSDSSQQSLTLTTTNSKKSGQHHYIGEIISNVNLNDNGSTKQTHHLEIACEEEIDYEPGDAAGILLEESDEHLKQCFPDIKGKIIFRLQQYANLR